MADHLNPNRHLDLEGSYNVRDLGGYPGENGRKTRWEMFLRSGSMHRMTPRAQSALIDLGVRTVIDLRTTREVQERPNVFADGSMVAYYHLNMIGDDPLDESSVAEATGEPAETIVHSYCIFLDQRQTKIGQILHALSRDGAQPVVFHCAGGKDRTGIISALILGIAEVPLHLIAQDYALSARFLLDRYFAEEAPPGISAANFTWRDFERAFCPADAMLTVLKYLQQEYDGVLGYAKTVGLSDDEITTLRDKILQ